MIHVKSYGPPFKLHRSKSLRQKHDWCLGSAIHSWVVKNKMSFRTPIPRELTPDILTEITCLLSICYMLWYPCSKCYMPKYIQLIRKAFSRKQRLIWALIETSRKIIRQFSVMWHCLQLQYNIVVPDSIIHDIHISISVLGFFARLRNWIVVLRQRYTGMIVAF